ncbi:LysR family transcriptional regulator [Paenibacillus massiliensis]|uniref:LysR substrate-binding domain-containing protein n=1 Tax=Paenibacillus massiliensis TaxID=225917 RepID=UPI00055F99CC|nr:LysR family transcriptional regulator [Paenibacillus massiliensis]
MVGIKVNLEQLKYVVEVAKAQSLSAASAHLHVTQSAISQSIQRLEQELHMTLFERSRSGTVPTPAGKAFIAKALDILQQMDELRLMYTDPDLMTGELSVAAFPSVMPHLVRTVAQMKQEHPLLSISIEEKGSMEIIRDIRSNRTHLGFIVIYDKDLRSLGGLHFRPLHATRLVVCVHHQSELAKLKRISPAQLKAYPLALYRDGFIEDFVEEFTYQHGPLSILFNTNNAEAITTVLSGNIAATIGHDFSFYHHPLWKLGQLKLIELNVTEQPKMQIGFVQSESRELAVAAERFMQQCIHAMETEQIQAR